jgi:predicted ATPase/class 3 adenylate cyclase
MGSDLLERFRQAGLESAGQRRNVTILFADLSGYTSLAEQMDSEDLYELVQKFIRLMVEEVYKYEGMVDKIIGDGLMALFGAPIAHENNAERAVRAAQDMLASVVRLSEELKERLGVALNMHIGLHSGTVIVGGVGSNLLMDYTAIGDTVNLAHRLEEVAEAGTILVSESVYHATRALFDYEPSPDLDLKGISRPVKGYLLSGLKSRPGSVRGLEGLRSPLVGREAELQQLKGAVHALANYKHGRFVLVTGEAGIGKTRLTAELKGQIERAPLRVLEGHSLTYRRSVSYWIFLEVLRDFLGITMETPPAKARERLVTKVYECAGAQAAEVLPYLEYLLALEHLDPVSAERLAYLDASQLRQQIFLAVRDLLVAEARRRPLLLILEDLHWADEASLDLLAFLVDSVRRAPLMIYAISRPFQDGPLGRMADHAHKWLPDWFIEIELQSLSLDQSERLLYQLLAIPELPAEVRQQILQRSAGIPFYLEEILRMLIDEQVIHQENGHWRLVPGIEITSLGVPDNLQGLILARFDRLEPFCRKVLQSASVIGRQFNLSLLASVMRLADEVELKQALAQLVEKAFLLPQSSPQELDYLFRHVLTSDAVYSTLLRRDRDELHGLVGEAMERLYAGRLEGQIEVLAGHFLRSPRPDRALYYLILAGERAGRDYANQQARQHYAEALALLPRVAFTTEQALQVLGGLGDVLVFTGEYAAAREHYLKALNTIDQAGPSLYTRETSALQRKIGTTFERQGDFDQALLYLAEAGKALENQPPSQSGEKAQILNDIGWIHFLRGSFEDAHSFLSAALNLVENSRKYDVVASIHNRLGAVAYQQRAYDQAVAHVRKSLALRETIGDMSGVARLYNNLGLLGLMRGNLRDAEANFVQSIELLERIGDAEGIALSYINLGLVQLDRGDLKVAEANLLRGSTAAEQIGHRFYLGLAQMYLGRLRTAQGQSSESEQLLEESLRIFMELGAQDNLIDAVYYLGENCFAQGDLLCASEWASKADEFITNASVDEKTGSVQRGRVQRLHGAIARVNGDIDQAGKRLLESAEIFNASYERLESARTALERGLLASAQKNYLEARQQFQEARLIFRQLGADVDLQRTEEALQHLH